MVSKKVGNGLDIKSREPKKMKGYYLPDYVIQDIKDVASEMGASENEVIVAIYDYWKANSNSNMGG